MALLSAKYRPVIPSALGEEARKIEVAAPTAVLIRPDGYGMKKVTYMGGFCGSPKWMNDSRHVLAYCSTAQQTMDLRR